MNDQRRIQTFSEFYPYYLKEHSRKATRIAHFMATGLALGFLSTSIYYGQWFWAPLGMGAGYGLSWISHFCIEKNRPATFRYPLYSFIADFRMFLELLTGRLRF